MLKKALAFSCLGIFLLHSPALSYSLFENETLSLGLGSYLRLGVASLKNSVDLDSANRDDSTTYLGLDYGLGLAARLKKQDAQFYLRLERNGPSDLDTPLFVHNTLMTSAGVIEEYRDDELLPQIEEFWLDAPLARDFRFKTGLYIYEVGNGFSLNGSYENYGFSLSRQWKDSFWRFYYCRPDLVYKNHLGPRIRQEEEQDFRYETNAANFFATDLKFNYAGNCFHPYLGALVDYTAPQKRDNAFAAPVKKDILGTVGMSWKNEGDHFGLNLEAAHNFGKAKTEGPDYKDIYHTGYLFFVDLDYKMGRVTPSLQLLLCSGNKVTPEMAANGDEKLASGKNRAFSYTSPLNNNLDDSISGYNVQARPILAMAAGFGHNYGVPRPGTFASSDFDNLLMPSLNCDFKATDKLCLEFYIYYIMSFARPVGTWDNQGRYLSRELGRELDLVIEYKMNPRALISVLAAVFSPGRYYKEIRDDTSGSLFSPYLRGDGSADFAYQFEAAIEFTF